MTKRLFFFVFSLIATVAMQAQSLDGTWVSKMVDDEGTAIDLYFIFNKPNLTMKAVVVANDNEVGEFTVSFQLPGTYTQTDKKLTINMNKDKVKRNFDKAKFTPEIEKQIKENPALKDYVQQMMEKTLAGMEPEMFIDLPLRGDLIIKELTATKLVLDDDGYKVEFTKVR
jgi:hypothetical protein